MKYTFEFFEYGNARDPGTGYYKFYDEFGRETSRDGGCADSWPKTKADAQARCNYLEWYDALPVGQRVGGWLSEIRTVHSRAIDAIRRLVKDEHGNYVHPYDWTEDQFQEATSQGSEEDGQIVRHLYFVAEFLRWAEKTGRPPKYPGAKK